MRQSRIDDAWHCRRCYGTTAISEHNKAWQCIGCGKIEAPQTCIGICQNRKVEFVYAFEHDDALAQLALAHTQVRRLAWTKPREHEWEHSYRALQEQVRELLAALQIGPAAAGGELRHGARP